MRIILLAVAIMAISTKAAAESGKPVFIVRKSSFYDTTVLPAILSLPLNSFIGKPVDSLLTKLPANHTSRGFMPLRIRYLRGIYQLYGTNVDNMVTIEIYIDEFHFMQIPRSANLPPWDMSLARKEKIAYIKIFKNNTTCIYGCDNPNYHY